MRSDIVLVDATAHGGIAPRIQIDHQHLAPGSGQEAARFTQVVVYPTHPSGWLWQ